jgi:arylsulfatase A-like enzyme
VGIRLFCLFPLLAANVALFGAVAPIRADDAKPNIVWAVDDDLGWKDVCFHGSDIKTSNLDGLARNGVRMAQFCASPRCTPTRAALLTGRHLSRYGLQTLIIPSGNTHGLATDEWLLPQALNEAACDTTIIGKWHLDRADQQFWPRPSGFDYQYGPLIGKLDYFIHKQHCVVDLLRNNKRVNEEGYTPTLLGDDAGSDSQNGKRESG